METADLYDKLKEKWKNEKAERKRFSENMRRSVLQKGAAVFGKYGVRRAIIFGSVIENRASSYSDIDLLVMPLSSENFWSFRHDLEEAVGYPVDLHTQDDDTRFVSKAEKRGEVIYEI